MRSEPMLHRRGTEDAEASQRKLTEQIIGAAMEVHTELGAGLLESVYQEALATELNLQGLAAKVQTPVPLSYKGRVLGTPLRIDLLVEDTVVVEVKAVDVLAPIHTAQLLTYLRLAGKQVGLLINFNTAHLRDGIKRVSNSPLRPSASSVPLR